MEQATLLEYKPLIYILFQVSFSPSAALFLPVKPSFVFAAVLIETENKYVERDKC